MVGGAGTARMSKVAARISENREATRPKMYPTSSGCRRGTSTPWSRGQEGAHLEFQVLRFRVSGV